MHNEREWLLVLLLLFGASTLLTGNTTTPPMTSTQRTRDRRRERANQPRIASVEQQFNEQQFNDVNEKTFQNMLDSRRDHRDHYASDWRAARTIPINPKKYIPVLAKTRTDRMLRKHL